MPIPVHLKITKEQRNLAIRHFVQYVEDSMEQNNLDLSELLEKEQEYKDESDD